MITERDLQTAVDLDVRRAEDDKTIRVGMLDVRRAYDTCVEAKEQPNPRLLADGLIVEWHLGVCYADTNNGKSIYCVQITQEAAEQGLVCLYVDIELDDKDFQLRATDPDTEVIYPFHPNFHRATIAPERLKLDEEFEDSIIRDIEAAAVEIGAQFIVIDNLSWILNAAEKGEAAGRLMQRLYSLKMKHRWTMLIVAHCPKHPPYKPIVIDDLAGSKKIGNFIDFAFAIGRSAIDPALRYIIQTKWRHGEMQNGPDNVRVYEIRNVAGLTQFVYLRCEPERNHLKTLSDDETTSIDENIIRLASEGLTQREIAAQVGLSLGKINRILKQKKEEE